MRRVIDTVKSATEGEAQVGEESSPRLGRAGLVEEGNWTTTTIEAVWKEWKTVVGPVVMAVGVGVEKKNGAEGRCAGKCPGSSEPWRLVQVSGCGSDPCWSFSLCQKRGMR